MSEFNTAKNDQKGQVKEDCITSYEQWRGSDLTFKVRSVPITKTGKMKFETDPISPAYR